MAIKGRGKRGPARHSPLAQEIGTAFRARPEAGNISDLLAGKIAL
jgi:hypothetical protein